MEVHLTVAGTSREAAVELVKRLEQSPSFRDARITEESAMRRKRIATDTVKFQLTALYVPMATSPKHRPDGAARLRKPKEGRNDRRSPGCADPAAGCGGSAAVARAWPRLPCWSLRRAVRAARGSRHMSSCGWKRSRRQRPRLQSRAWTRRLQTAREEETQFNNERLAQRYSAMSEQLSHIGSEAGVNVSDCEIRRARRKKALPPGYRQHRHHDSGARQLRAGYALHQRGGTAEDDAADRRRSLWRNAGRHLDGFGSPVHLSKERGMKAGAESKTKTAHRDRAGASSRS